MLEFTADRLGLFNRDRLVRAMHGSKLLLALGSAAIVCSALSIAYGLAHPVPAESHNVGTVGVLSQDASRAVGERFTDATDSAVLNLVKAYGGAAASPQSALFSLTQLAESSPAIPRQAYWQLTPQQALAINTSIAFSNQPNPAARPFRLASTDVANHDQALDCLTAAVYYEAASESDDGEAAVAQVVLNRLRHPLFPKTVCGVVFQGSELPTGCQFTFSCDGSLGRRPSVDGWARARKIAERALDGYVMKRVGEATHYHTQWVVPYWQPTLTKLTQIGAHIFYRWSGGMGSPEAFHGQYAGFEVSPPAALGPGEPAVALAAAAPEPPKAVSVQEASQAVVALTRADNPAAAPTVTLAADASGAAKDAVAQTPKPAPPVQLARAAPPPRISYFGHAPAARVPTTPW